VTANPLYYRIQRDISDSITAGEYAPGARIPSEAALAERYGVTRMTVRQAVDGLISKGLVTRRQGSGTYVLRPREAQRGLNRLTSFTEDMHVQGHRTTSEELERGEAEPPPYVQEQLELQTGAHTVVLERLRRLDEEPVALHRVWLPLWLAPGLARRALKNGASLYETLELELGVRLSSARQSITAVAADERDAGILEVELGSPLLFTQRLTRDANNRPVEFAESWTVPKLSLWVDLYR
jgi:GntR family transcriptional regulator